MNGKGAAIDSAVGTAGLAAAAWAYLTGHPVETTIGLLTIVLLVMRILVAWREWRRLS